MCARSEKLLLTFCVPLLLTACAVNDGLQRPTTPGDAQVARFGLDMGMGVDVWNDPATSVTRIAVSTANPPTPGVVIILRQASDGSWVQEDMVTVPGESNDRFGASVALEGDILAVGVPFDDSNSINDPLNNDAPDSGAVYVFERIGSDWNEVIYLKANTIRAHARFGWSVDLSGNRLIVGAPSDNKNADRGGAVYAFSRSISGVWTVDPPLLDVATLNQLDGFGYSVALDGDWIAVGTPRDDSGIHNNAEDDSQLDSGAVYVYHKPSNQPWTLAKHLKSVVIETTAHFGWSVDISGDVLVAGAPTHSFSASTGTSGIPAAGFVNVYQRAATPPTSWVPVANLIAPNRDAHDQFGFSVAIDDDMIVVTAPLEDGDGTDPADNSLANAGAGYVYVRDGGNWQHQDYLKAAAPLANQQLGGYLFDFKKGDTAAVDDGSIAIGAPGRETEVFGSLHVFQ